MRDLSLGRVTPVASVFSLIIAAAGTAAAQTQPSTAPAATAPPTTAPATAAPNTAPATPAPAPAPQAAPVAPPPPGYAYAPAPAYAPPPPGYAYAYPPPPGFAPVYAAPSRTQELPYHGGPIPQGFHLEERPRRGLIIGGALTLGIPWMLGVTIASTDNFSNQSGWLIVPTLGPWITIATRRTEKNCDLTFANSGASVSDCHDDNAVRTVLILDGLTQAAGTIMLIAGLSSDKKVMVRDFVSNLHFAPAPMGKLGYGGVLTGEF